jgi:D-sedoheptulose 7-phosphate isomerase
MKQAMISQINGAIEIFTAICGDDALLGIIENLVNRIVQTFNSGGKVLIAGNGGSAADAQHIAGEFVSRFNFNRSGLPAIALTTDTSVLTAIGNDYGYEELFARQIQALGRPGDVFWGISTSGRSPNILRAIEQARKNGLFVAGFFGANDGIIDNPMDLYIRVPSRKTPRIQEAHILLGHIVCGLVEERAFKP